MKSLAEIWKFAAAKDPSPPGPYEIALTLAAALLSSGRFADDAGAAMDTAWTMVIPFYQGQAAYERHVKAIFDITRHASAPEGDMTRDEARAYVGGETGGGPELATMRMTMPASQTIDLEAVRARQQHIAECSTRVQAAAAALDLARRTKRGIRAAEAEWDAATKEQSEAYL